MVSGIAGSPCRKTRRLTPRSTGAPTAGHQARAVGTRYIFASPGLASHRRCPVSSTLGLAPSRRGRHMVMAPAVAHKTSSFAAQRAVSNRFGKLQPNPMVLFFQFVKAPLPVHRPSGSALGGLGGGQRRKCGALPACTAVPAPRSARPNQSLNAERQQHAVWPARRYWRILLRAGQPPRCRRPR